MKSFMKKLMSTAGLLVIASVAGLAEVPAPKVPKLNINPVSTPKMMNHYRGSKVGAYPIFMRPKDGGPLVVNFKPLEPDGNVADKAYAMSRHIDKHFEPLRMAGAYHRYSRAALENIWDADTLKFPQPDYGEVEQVSSGTISPATFGVIILRGMPAQDVPEVTKPATPSDLKFAEDAPLLRESISQ